MNTIIIDDEKLARQKIRLLCEKNKDITILEECRNGKEAILAINKLKPDLIFLDIQMTDMTGFEVLNEIEVDKKPMIVFVTAFDEYALQAFNYNTFDFLLKPYDEERFLKTINKIKNLSQKEVENDFSNKMKSMLELHQLSGNKKIPIKKKNKTLLVKCKDVKYICAAGYHSEIFTENQKHVVRDSLNNLYEFLPESDFYRIHRSTIINLDYIEEMLHSDYAELDVRMKDSKIFRISKALKKGFLEKLGLYGK